MQHAASVTSLKGQLALHHLPRILRLRCPNLSSARAPAPPRRSACLQCLGTHPEQAAVVDFVTILAVLSAAADSAMIPGLDPIFGSCRHPD
mmetsp:Transcript_14070/g.31180  ORF Transcript_14070/g.31180 Transcript_14070/m.31180 type:complete len:91 (-) Transcript_14070:1471-1743(-)